MSRTAKPGELILSHRAWQALRPLMLDRGHVAVGNLREHEDDAASELRVDRLQVQTSPHTGASQPPLASWVTIAVEHPPTASPGEWLARIAPRQSQLAAVLTLSAADRGCWDGVVFDRGHVRPLDGFWVVGPGMLHLSRTPRALLDDETRLRWSRTMGSLTEDIWRKIHEAHVVQIGCGRNGTLMAWQLASLGVSRMSLADGDMLLAIENLDAMPGLSYDDVGDTKVEALGRRLVAFRPDISLRCFAAPVTDVLDRLLSRADLIVTCVDDDAARLAASWLSREILAPHLDVGTAVQWRSDDEQAHIHGDVRFLLPHEGCVACAGSLDDPDRCFYELAAPPGSLHRGEPVVWTQQRAGSLVTNGSLATATAGQIWIDYLAGRVRTSQWHRLVWKRGAGLETQFGRVTTGAVCDLCQSSAR